MEIGIGLPNHVAEVEGRVITEWSRRAEEAGFESVTTIDRPIYPNIDSIIALALAAGVTAAVGLVANVLLAPLYPPVLLAKQLAGVADASGGRLTVGMGVGSRADDYAAMGVDFASRGALLDDSVAICQEAWAGEAVADSTPLCPTATTIPLLFGGKSPATLRRIAAFGDGWAAGAVRDLPAQSSFADRVRAGWREAGRTGSPFLQASLNFAMGDEAVVDAGRGHLRRYYGFAPEYAALNVTDMVATPEDARSAVRAYRDLGFHRLLFHPAVATGDQVDRLAEAVL
ncbi:LLM class flavin-dependent oxidoreductase [Mycolicibacterium sp. 050158]|uniref:LLM class flavin-dependent oxidoreductase n=1 Tax=Mycolicibacterium sp. 050158 TaxID=3090602 RepID=UPI00299E7F11|nr:LLM class flavin-dependent oxidoreductase [Mycolicibacterium sp. 050158]MDX1889088.1 LLM class flavin-dependent oxidoreductase [Mycolicibacterium sp. 050158]